MKETLEKNPYAHIEFTYCGLNYDYTVCEFGEIADQISIVEMAFLDADDKDFEEFGKPEIKITPVLMTEQEYDDLKKGWERSEED